MIDFDQQWDIKIQGVYGLQQEHAQALMASYLLKGLLRLRDIENKKREIRLFGSGSAISQVLTVTEILRQRLPDLYSIVEFENLQRENNQEQKEQTAVRVKLTYLPNEDDKKKPGYQEPTQQDDAKLMDLFNYIQIYSTELHHLKVLQRQQRQDRPYQPKQYQQRGNRRQVEQGDRNNSQDDQNQIQNQNQRSQSNRGENQQFKSRGTGRDVERNERRDNRDNRENRDNRDRDNRDNRDRDNNRDTRRNYDNKRITKPQFTKTSNQVQTMFKEKQQDQQKDQPLVIRRGGARKEQQS